MELCSAKIKSSVFHMSIYLLPLLWIGKGLSEARKEVSPPQLARGPAIRYKHHPLQCSEIIQTNFWAFHSRLLERLAIPGRLEPNLYFPLCRLVVTFWVGYSLISPRIRVSYAPFTFASWILNPSDGHQLQNDDYLFSFLIKISSKARNGGDWIWAGMPP